MHRFALCALLALFAAAGCVDLPQPRITALVPEQAPAGAAIDVVGEGFGPPAADAFTTVGGVQAADSLWEPRRIRLTVPALPPGATLVVVSVAGRVSAPIDFRVAEPPPLR